MMRACRKCGRWGRYMGSIWIYSHFTQNMSSRPYKDYSDSQMLVNRPIKVPNMSNFLLRTTFLLTPRHGNPLKLEKSTVFCNYMLFYVMSSRQCFSPFSAGGKRNPIIPTDINSTNSKLSDKNSYLVLSEYYRILLT